MNALRSTIVLSSLLSLCGFLSAATEEQAAKGQDGVILKLKVGDEEPAAAEEAPRADWKDVGSVKTTKKQDGAIVMVQGFEKKEIDNALDCPREFSLPALKEVDEKVSLRLLDENREQAKADANRTTSASIETRVEKAAKAAKPVKKAPAVPVHQVEKESTDRPADNVIQNLTY